MDFTTRELERRKNNEAVMARWMRHQQDSTFSFQRGAISEKRPWHDGQDSVLGEAQIHEPRYNLVPHPKDPTLLKKLIERTSARLAVWRAGVRPTTAVSLDFLADHAITKSAVYEKFPDNKVTSLGLMEVKSLVSDKDEFLLRPDLGRQLSEESKHQLQTQVVQEPDVQIVVSDGLSGLSLEVNIEKLLPELSLVLSSKGYKLGTPIYCRFARVALQDRIGEIVKAKASVILIGERPGLGTGDGLSAYLIYQPNPQSTHANRNCISNIHPRGIHVPEAAKYIEYTLTKMFEQKTSGVTLELR